MNSRDDYNKGASAPRGVRPHPALVVLATIGGLVLILMAAFMIMIAWLSKGGIKVSATTPGPGIGIIRIEGVITDPESTLKCVRDFKRRKDVKAVIVRINSPGGAVGAAQEIFQALTDLDKKKPVIASLESIAASGGYYAALGARKIVANPGTLTGSIGVIMEVPNIGPLLKRLGIETTVVKSGTFKDIGSPTRAMTGQEKALLEGVLKDVHNQFMEDVSRRRSISMKQVKELAQGQVFSGRKAKTLGLVDILGNFNTAIEEAKRLGRIKGEPRLIYPRKGRLELIRRLLEEQAKTSVRNIIRGIFLEYAT